jgi:uncharacterized protein YbbC (DUF1343 family)
MRFKMEFRLCVIALFAFSKSFCQGDQIVVGSEQPDLYLSQLEGKTIALVVNQTSKVFDNHLVDYLTMKGIKVAVIFAPEHGFRGIEEEGKLFDDYVDSSSGIRVISLYSSKKAPSKDDLKGIDIVVFDIQDVGVRFYTYISTLHLVMEACAENNKKLIVLDRPNPNGDYIDGPVRIDSLKSFVGLDPIPIVYGLTIGELAGMINGEKWLKDSLHCNLVVIPLKNYDHSSRYILPVKPSPNLPNDQSIRLYPSLCLFEGTIMSVGRGTDFPFQVIGYPDSISGSFIFIPHSSDTNTNPLYKNKTCFGKDYRNINPVPTFTLSFFLEFYNRMGKKNNFFNSYFNQLVGNYELKEQIIAGFSEEEIRITWYDSLKRYKDIRKRYLLYADKI